MKNGSYDYINISMVNQNLFILQNIHKIMINQHKKRMIQFSIGILILIILYALKNTNYFLRTFTFLFSIGLFFFGDKFFELKFKPIHYLILILISTAGILLSAFYGLYPNYDKALHLISPVLISILVFYLINKTDLKFSTKLLITFSVVIMSLAMFEIIEYLLDTFFDMKLQGVFLRSQEGLTKLNLVMDKNKDTMIDLILGSLGSLGFIIYKTITFHILRLKKKK